VGEGAAVDVEEVAVVVVAVSALRVEAGAEAGSDLEAGWYCEK